MKEIEQIFDFLHAVAKLKTTLRYTSRDSKLLSESVADHSWRMSLMVWMFADTLEADIDKYHAVKLAIAHDLGEYLEGDIDYRLIYEGKATLEQKHTQAARAMDELKKILPEKIGEEVYSLWKEYGDGETPESKFVRAMDKLEAMTHICEAGHSEYNQPESIPNYADKCVKEVPALSAPLKILKTKLKAEFDKGGIPWKSEYD